MADYSLRLGETAKVRPRWWGKSWTVTYAGVLHDGTYSVVVTWLMGHQSAAYNLFLGRDQREFQLPVGTVRIVELSPDRLRLRFE